MALHSDVFECLKQGLKWRPDRTLREIPEKDNECRVARFMALESSIYRSVNNT